MKYRNFGDSGISLSELCFGTWRYATTDGVYDSRSEAGGKALLRAIDAGINCIHSSFEYGTWWLTGKLLQNHPQRTDLLHIVKINEPDFGDDHLDRNRFRAKIEYALTELHTDRIAVVQHLHRGLARKTGIYQGIHDDVRICEFDRDFLELQDETELLKREGKIASLASFPYTLRFARHAVASGIYDGLVVYFNILETESLELFAEIKRREMGVIGIRPLCGGLLTDKRIDRSRLVGDDRLLSSQWDGKYQQLAILRSTMIEEPTSWTQYAIRMSLAHPLVATSTLSMNTEKQLKDALEATNATEGALSPLAELKHIHEINKKILEEQNDS